MSKFFCNGADSECACPILCADCTAADWTGGTEIKTKADRIRAMSDEEMVKPGNDGGEPLENQISFLKEKGGAE